VVFWELNQFWSFWSKSLGSSAYHPGDSKSSQIISQSATLDSLLRKFWKSKIAYSEFRYPELKSEIISSPFLLYKASFHPLCIIGSVRYLNFRTYLSMHLVNKAYHFCICHFFEDFFPPICRTIHQRIVFLQLHNILKAFIATTPWEFITFWMISSTPSVHSLRYLVIAQDN